MNTLRCLATTLLVLAVSATAHADGGIGEILIGHSINPVPLDLRGKSWLERISIYRGSYYVNGAADCVGCHHAGHYLAGGDPFLGQPEMINTATFLGGGVPFGPFISRNLTPDASGRPAGLSWPQFLDVMRKGTDFRNIPPHVPGSPGLLQVMPWPFYRHMTTDVLRAVYDYLSVVPCLEGGPGQAPNRCGS